MRRWNLRGPISLAFEEEAARQRTDPENRPRDGWHLSGTQGVQTWWLEGNTFNACVWGRQLTPPWRYSVHMPTIVHVDGEADSLASAMAEAERMIKSAN